MSYGHHGQGHRKHGKTSRRDSSSKGSSEPSPSFLFRVDRLEPYDDPARFDTNGNWSPPSDAAGYQDRSAGTLYRWDNGTVSRANIPNGDVVLYRAVTMFYCNPFLQFYVAEGDVTTRDMGTADFPEDRWYSIHFRHDNEAVPSPVSYLDYAGDQTYLAGNSAEFVPPLGLNSYENQDSDPRNSGGLAGNLAMLIALISFSCRRDELDAVLRDDRAWRSFRWRGHDRRHGRRDMRGMIVSIYLDPQNLSGSTSQNLYNLEWFSGALLV